VSTADTDAVVVAQTSRTSSSDDILKVAELLHSIFHVLYRIEIKIILVVFCVAHVAQLLFC